MRFKGFLFLTALALLLGPSLGLSQFGGQPGGFGGQGGGFGQGGGRGGRGGSRDPGAMFDSFANGKQSITKADITNPFMQMMFDQVAQSAGSTNGQITREQWVTAMGQIQQQFGGPGGRGAQGGAATPGRTTAGAQTPSNPVAGGLGGNTNPWGGGGNNPWGGGNGNRGGGGGRGGNWNPDTIADMRFRQLDTNGDGLLNTDEMQADETLLAEHDKWDANGDGFIDQNEFRSYFRARIQQFQANGAGGGVQPMPGQDDLEQKPTVYRAGKLPPNLPAWFTQYDTDGDGQVGLYEWKAAGQDMARFEAMDINGDGFLTVEEVLRSPEVVAQAGGQGNRGGLALGQGTGSPARFGQTPGAFGQGRGGNRGQGQGGFGQGQGGFGGRGGNRGQGGFGQGQGGFGQGQGGFGGSRRPRRQSRPGRLRPGSGRLRSGGLWSRSRRPRSRRQSRPGRLRGPRRQSRPGRLRRRSERLVLRQRLNFG